MIGARAKLLQCVIASAHTYERSMLPPLQSSHRAPVQQSHICIFAHLHIRLWHLQYRPIAVDAQHLDCMSTGSYAREEAVVHRVKCRRDPDLESDYDRCQLHLTAWLRLATQTRLVVEQYKALQ